MGLFDLFKKKAASLSPAQQLSVYVNQLMDDYQQKDFHVSAGRTAVSDSILAQISTMNFPDYDECTMNERIRYASLLIHEHCIHMLRSGKYCVRGTTLTPEGTGIMTIFRLNGSRAVSSGELTRTEMDELIRDILNELKYM